MNHDDYVQLIKLIYTEYYTYIIYYVVRSYTLVYTELFFFYHKSVDFSINEQLFFLHNLKS